MNVALVTETYPPEINGVTMTLSQLVQGLRDRGHVVQVVRPYQRGEARVVRAGRDELVVHGVPIPRYSELRFGVPSRNRLVLAWRRQRPDIVHVATEGLLGLSAIRAARHLGIPCVSSFHTNFHSYSEHYGAAFMTPVVLAYLRWFHNQTLCSMAPTKELVDELAGEGFRDPLVLGRGVKLDVFNPRRRDEDLRRHWGCGPDTMVAIHVSRLAAEKDYEGLFNIYRAIERRNSDCRFVIVGDGPLRERLRRSFPQAIFTGAIPLTERERLASLYAAADLFVYPSTTETYGNVVTEAMACGLPVVAYDYAAAAMHIKDGYNGALARLGDFDSLRGRAVALSVDPETTRRMGEAASQTAKGFDWEPVIDGFEQRLREYAGRVDA